MLDDATRRVDRFRRTVLVGQGKIGDRIWMRPSVTVIGIDVPPVLGSIPAIPPELRARMLLRVAHGTSAAEAEAALRAQLLRAAPWGAKIELETESVTQPFQASTGGPATG